MYRFSDKASDKRHVFKSLYFLIKVAAKDKQRLSFAAKGGKENLCITLSHPDYINLALNENEIKKRI